MFFQQIAPPQKNTLAHESALMGACFPGKNKFNQAYLTWLYFNNPEGHVIGFNAWDENRLVAHYACIPRLININGENVKALLSLNTATHPDYQGKGLFTKLAHMTYDLASSQGYSSVFGIANSNSTPGFIRKLGFQLVEPLEARIGMGSLHINFDAVTNKAYFQPAWTKTTLSWRCANPNNPVSKQHKSNSIGFHATAFGKLSVYAEHTTPLHEIDNETYPDALLLPLRLFIGLLPEGSCSFRQYYTIPHCFRPSPLNFIYRSLDNKTKHLEKGRTFFSFMDFDAY